MLNFASGQDIHSVDWIKECTSLRTLDIHFSNSVGEDRLRVALKGLPYLENLSHLLVEFDRTPEILSELILDLTMGIKKSKNLEYLGLFIKNSSKTEQVYQNLEALPLETKNIKELSLSFCDSDSKSIEFSRLCSMIGGFDFLERFKLELSFSHMVPCLKDLEKQLANLTNLVELQIILEIKSCVDETKFCPPVELMPKLKTLSIHQKIDNPKWMFYNLGSKLLKMPRLEEFEYVEGIVGLNYEMIGAFMDRIKIKKGLKKLHLIIPMYMEVGNLSQKLGKQELDVVRKKVKEYFDRWSRMQELELFVTVPQNLIYGVKNASKTHEVICFKRQLESFLFEEPNGDIDEDEADSTVIEMKL